MPTKLQLIEQQMPVLPGYAMRKHRPSFHKSHYCDFADGVPVVYKEIAKHEHLDAAEGDAEHEAAPGWKALDRKVLRFFGEFVEPAVPTVPERVHKVYVLYYLEDGTVQVSEPRVHNSGATQGRLVRRHHIKPNPPALEEFNVGKHVTIYAKKIALQACDHFTREYLRDAGVHVPQDLVDAKTMFAEAEAPAKPKKSPSFVVSESQNRSFKKFFQHDGQVLRFYCVWDDTVAEVAGELHRMVLHYFLADDTIEIRQQVGPTGANTVPFLRRHRIPKNAVSYSMDGSNLAPPSAEAQNALFFSAKDLAVGKVVHVYGKPIALCECDGFTEKYIREQVGASYAPIQRARYAGYNPQTQEILVKQAVGPVVESAADVQPELGTFPGSAAPKEPKKKGADEKIILRFSAVLKTDVPLDQQRRFVISYFYVDNSFAVYETQLLNSGIPGGKFLDRTQIKKAGARVNYSSKDLAIGAELVFFGRTFVLRELDSFTKVYVTQYPHVFPKLV